ncbi:MAG: lysophospholipid acyltransferase family protein [Planctomycetia bacterium]|nr:lysophospholipid acyltransferase family protein [Planctomycetia bacterium]
MSPNTGGLFTSVAWGVQYCLGRCGQAAVLLLPEVLALAAGRVVATVLWTALRKRSGIARKEATRVLGKRGAEVAQGSFQHLMETIIRTMRAPRDRSSGRWERRVEIRGLENLERAVAMGRGVIAVSGHFGDWETFNIALAARGHRVFVVRRAMDNPYMNRGFESFWKQVGTRVIWRKGAMREGLQALREGGVLTLYVDQDARHQGIFVPFLGRAASTIKAPALLSLKSGAPILGFAVTRQPGGRSLIQIEEPFVADASLPKSDAVLASTRKLTEALEKRILEAPEQWMWIHRRWKTKPEEAVPADADPA